MRKIFTILIFFLLHIEGKTQAPDSITSVNNYFAGIPVKEGFKKWVEYLYNHPDLGLDSANYRGTYSSMKPGMKNHFPFPNSIEVKILAENILFQTPVTGKYSVQQDLLIEGIFGDGDTARKKAVKYYEQLEKSLKKYYKIRTTAFNRTYFSKGVNKNFPPFDMQIGYAEELKFYYIILHYEQPDK